MNYLFNFFFFFNQVSVDKGQVKVKAKRSDLGANKKTKDMCKLMAGNSKTVVVVGGGPSGATCAETLRQEGFNGRIVMICRENVLPYDRVKVSKTIDFDVQKALLRSQKFYDDNNIETKLGVSATKLDTEKKIVYLSNGEQLFYNYLYIATGCCPKKPDVEGVDLENVFVMRDYTDAETVYKQLGPDKHVVTIGLGFIGMEAAAYCVDKVASVTVIGRDAVPFKAIFGEDIGKRIKKEFEDKGVKFLSKNGIQKFIPKKNDEKVLNEVQFLDGTTLKADVIILGIGSTFYTDWLKNSELQLREDGSITVDKV